MPGLDNRHRNKDGEFYVRAGNYPDNVLPWRKRMECQDVWPFHSLCAYPSIESSIE